MESSLHRIFRTIPVGVEEAFLLLGLMRSKQLEVPIQIEHICFLLRSNVLENLEVGPIWSSAIARLLSRLQLVRTFGIVVFVVANLG